MSSEPRADRSADAPADIAADPAPHPATEGHGPGAGPDAGPASPAEHPHEPPSDETVEQVVRRQMSAALGGARGMVEAAVPTIAFTITFLTLDSLRTALIVSLAAAGLLLLVRIVQRSTVQFIVNAFVGIGIGAAFAYRSLQQGGDADDAALAYFLPGLLYNAGYAVVMIISILVRWPVVGVLVGSVTGDLTSWRDDPGVVRLCRNLTWFLVLPCLVRVVVQAPLYVLGSTSDDAGAYIAALGVSKIAMGWPLQLAALAGMVWLLSRNRTARTTTAFA